MTSASPTMLQYSLTGAEQAPVVLFLHGFMGRGGDWDEVTQALGRRFACLTVDLPGHGASHDQPADRYAMAGAAEALVEVLDDAGVERCSVVGYSMGGRLALYFGLHHAGRCRRLVLESASPGLRTAAERAARRGVDEARAVRLETEDFDQFLEDWYRQPLFETLYGHPGLVGRVTRARRRNEPAELARSLRQMGTGRQPSLWEHLAALDVPTLAVAGALDGKYVEIAQRMAVLTTRIRTAIIPNAGHNVHAEYPDAFADLVREFLGGP